MAELPSDRANCAPLAKVRRKFPRSRDRNHGLWKLQSDATRDTSTTSEIVIFFFSSLFASYKSPRDVSVRTCAAILAAVSFLNVINASPSGCCRALIVAREISKVPLTQLCCCHTRIHGTSRARYKIRVRTYHSRSTRRFRRTRLHPPPSGSSRSTSEHGRRHGSWSTIVATRLSRRASSTAGPTLSPRCCVVVVLT